MSNQNMINMKEIEQQEKIVMYLEIITELKDEIKEKNKEINILEDENINLKIEMKEQKRKDLEYRLKQLEINK